jgi:uncharacterized membrane protein
VHSVVRLAVSLIVLACVALLLPEHMPLGARVLISWNAGVLTFLAIVLISIVGEDADTVRRDAERIGTGRGRVLLSTVAVGLVSLVAVVLVIYNVGQRDPGFRLYAALCVVTVLTSWLLLQTVFGLFYARYYYQPKPGSDTVQGGLRFVNDEPPDYWDFLYFSFTIGMTYTTSETNIVSRQLRRAVLLQGLVSFLIYTALIGVVMNVVAGL